MVRLISERLTSRSTKKSPRRHTLRRQPDSLDSVDSCSSVSSYSSSSHFNPSSSSSSTTTRRFRFHSKTPPQSANAPHPSQSDSLESPTGDPDGTYGERPQFSSRGTFNPDKGRQKLKAGKHSTARQARDGDGRGGDAAPQQVVMYGSSEFMV